MSFACPLGRPGRFGLTPLQQQVYRAIVEAWGYAPALFRHRDVRRVTGIDRASVTSVLRALVQRGWLAALPGGGGYMFTEPVMAFRAVSVGVTEADREAMRRATADAGYMSAGDYVAGSDQQPEQADETVGFR